MSAMQIHLTSNEARNNSSDFRHSPKGHLVLFAFDISRLKVCAELDFLLFLRWEFWEKLGVEELFKCQLS